MGGFDRAGDIIQHAEANDVLSVMTSSLETAVGLTASLHGAAILPQPLPACGLSLGRFFAKDVADPPQIKDGAMSISAAPGLGMDQIDIS